METPNVNHKRRVPLDKRKRTETSCDKCKTRKQKCDRLLGQAQCRYCEIHSVECTTTQPRKHRVYRNEESTRNRLALLESLVKGLLPEADLNNNDEMRQLGKSLGISLPVAEEGGVDSDHANIAHDDEYVLPPVPDQQGQIQYIGPASSFSFHHKLRSLIGNAPNFEFAMFGPNAAEEPEVVESPVLGVRDRQGRPALGSISSTVSSPSDAIREIDGPVLESLIDSYFDIVHSDFPVLHEASFRESYEIWSASTSSSPADPAWICGLLCVLILARRITSISIPLAAESKWWKYVQALLPTVVFSTNIFTVQALLLAALHLHNTSHRDACWNLTGTAVRVAYAIGLHRDDIKIIQGPLGRELRKQLWWTLFAFEHMQVSSYDRPSAIDPTVASAGCPNERIVGLAGHSPPELMKWSQKLVVLLGSTCKALSHVGSRTTGVQEAHSRPLSPVAGILRDLNRWKESLPPHLRLEVTDSLAPSSQRPLLLLHAQYYYLFVLITRSALLRRATMLSKVNPDPIPQILITISETCIDSGHHLGRIMRKLDKIGKFNACTWWDMFYTVAAALDLVLDIVCCVKQNESFKALESQKLLKELAALSTNKLQDPRTPGSMRKWASVLVEVATMVEHFSARPVHAYNQNSGEGLQSTQADPENRGHSYPSAAPDEDYKSPTAFNGRHNVAASALIEMGTSTQYHPAGAGSFLRSAPVVGDQTYISPNGSTEWTYLEAPDGQLHDWSWDDIGAILQGNSFL